MPNLMPHRIDECPQNPVLASINRTLAQWDKRMERQDDLMERQAVAMETIAAHGAMVAGHEKRLDKHDLDFREMFNRVNDERRLDKLAGELAALTDKVIRLERDHAKEEGEALVEAKVQTRLEADATENKKFWTELKIKMITPIMFATFFALWLIDKWSLAEKMKALVREFRG